jgi:AraC family transcriptional regulator
MNVRIENRPAQRVVFMRHVGPYDQVGGTWQRLFAFAGSRGLLRGPLTMMGVVHDDPEVTPPDKVRYDACLVVDTPFKVEGDVGVQEISGGDYAIATHQGPYQKLGETYARLCGEWLPRSGRELRSEPSLEIYRNSPMNTAPDDLLTDVYLPLE